MMAAAEVMPRSSAIPLDDELLESEAFSGAGPDFGTKAYTGREWDQETGLYYRARYYDAKVGRFLSEDPIGFFGGVNFYRFARNNPVNFTDPRGLAPEGSKCCAAQEKQKIEDAMENTRRIENLQKNGTAILPEDLAGGSVSVGGVSGCSSNGQYFVTIPPGLSPCVQKCVELHEKIHERQCRNLGPVRFAYLPEKESETPAYINELGCLIRTLKEAGPYP